jgi:hypothetical protein
MAGDYADGLYEHFRTAEGSGHDGDLVAVVPRRPRKDDIERMRSKKPALWQDPALAGRMGPEGIEPSTNGL